jgi:D-inositol-3-phosphate glycosyltransferase
VILGQTLPYLRRKGHFTLADQSGSWVVHQDMVRVALQYGIVDGVHIFQREGYQIDEIRTALEELRLEFPTHEIRASSLLELPRFVRESQYVFPVEFEMLSSLARVRQTAESCVFPISAIIHAVPSHRQLMLYAEALMFTEACDTIVVTSDAGYQSIKVLFDKVGEYLVARLKSPTLPKINLKKIPLGVSEEFLYPLDKQVARKSLNLPADGAIILFVGRLGESIKADLEPLLSVFKRYAAQDKNLYLVIAGREWGKLYGHKVASIAGKLGVGDQVIVRTNFPYSQKPLFYSSADIFVSPADNIQETYGITILEAMSSGLPVIASDWSGYRGLVAHGETGFLARTYWNNESGSFASKLVSLMERNSAAHFLAQQTVVDIEDLSRYLKLLLDDENLRRRMGDGGRKRVLANFSWGSIIKQYLELWEEQWNALKYIDNNETSRLSVDYNQIYSHYATNFVDGDVIFRLSQNESSSALMTNIDTRRIPFAIPTSEINRVLIECERQPQSIKTLTSSGNEYTSQAVTWLWKKGLLERDSS